MTKTPLLTPGQYDLLTDFLRAKPYSPGNQAARLVLVEGLSQKDASDKLSVLKTAVSNAVARYTKAHEKILAQYVTQ